MPAVFPRVLALLVAVLWVAFSADAAWAQSTGEAWPEWIGAFTPPKFPRGEGFYFGIGKIITALLIMLAWTASVDWVNRDALQHKLNYRLWNSIVFGPFVVAFLLLWILPWFSLSFLLLLTAYIGPFAAYVRTRNKALHDAEKVFTRDHLQFVLADKLKRFGVKIPENAKRKGPVEAPVTISPRGAPSQAEEQTRAITARQSPGYGPARALVHKALQTRASGIMLDFTPEAAAIRMLVDGLWLDVEAQPRALADPTLAALKLVCGLKPEDRRSRQQGTFLVVDDATKAKHPTKLVSQGTKTGERALVQFEDPAVRKRRLADLGLRQKLHDDVQAAMNATKGLVLIAAPPGGGLTSLTSVCLAAVDRFTRSAMAVEDLRNKDLEVENIPVTTYDSLEKETPAAKLPQVIRQFPDVLVVPEYTDSETLTILCGEADERLVVTSLRAREASEAVLRPLQTKVAPKKYVVAVSAVVVQRLIRKLCDKCKEAYPAPPQILQRIGLTPDKVPAFYRPPTQPRQEVCPECNGMGYRGQTAIVELLTMSDPVRQTILTKPTVEAVRAAAKKAGMKTFEDEGLVLVVKGITSVQELARVLKEGAAAT